MKKLLLLLASFTLFTAADAQAQEWCAEECCCVDQTDFYAEIASGVNFLQNTKTNGNKATYDTGYLVSGIVGYRWCHGLRLEAEYAYRRNAISRIHFFQEGSSKHGHFQTSSIMANLLWDLPLSSWGCGCLVQPYIGAGIGYDFQKMNASNSRVSFHQKWRHFSWQAIAGLSYPIFCNTELTLEYKYHQGGCEFRNQSLGIGILCHFDFLR